MVKAHLKTDRFVVTVGPDLMGSGWYGGQWVQYVGNRTVEKADAAKYAGFLLIGHNITDLDGKPYNYLEMDGLDFHVPNQYDNKAVNARSQATMICGGGDFDFNKNVYDTGQVYVYNDPVFVNNNGILTSVDTGYTPVGIVNMIPDDNAGGWLGVALKY